MKNSKENINMILIGMIMVLPLSLFFFGGIFIKDTATRATVAFSILMLLKIVFISKAIYEELKSDKLV